jgi:hypothetical protein
MEKSHTFYRETGHGKIFFRVAVNGLAHVDNGTEMRLARDKYVTTRLTGRPTKV